MFNYISWQTGANFMKRYTVTQIRIPVDEFVNRRHKLKAWRVVENALTLHFDTRRRPRKPTGGFWKI